MKSTHPLQAHKLQMHTFEAEEIPASGDILFIFKVNCVCHILWNLHNRNKKAYGKYIEEIHLHIHVHKTNEDLTTLFI